MSELVFKLLPQRYHHTVSAEQLPDFIREYLYEKGCTSDYSFNHIDGDFDLPVSYEELDKELGPIFRSTVEELAEGELDPFDEFLESIPEPYYKTNCYFLVRFCQ